MGRAAFERISEQGAINSWDLMKSHATHCYGLDSMQTEKLFLNMHIPDENLEDFILCVDRAYHRYELRLSDSVLLNTFIPKMGREGFLLHIRLRADILGMSLTWKYVVTGVAGWIKDSRRSFSANLWQHPVSETSKAALVKVPAKPHRTKT